MSENCRKELISCSFTSVISVPTFNLQVNTWSFSNGLDVILANTFPNDLTWLQIFTLNHPHQTTVSPPFCSVLTHSFSPFDFKILQLTFNDVHNLSPSHIHTLASVASDLPGDWLSARAASLAWAAPQLHHQQSPEMSPHLHSSNPPATFILTQFHVLFTMYGIGLFQGRICAGRSMCSLTSGYQLVASALFTGKQSQYLFYYWLVTFFHVHYLLPCLFQSSPSCGLCSHCGSVLSGWRRCLSDWSPGLFQLFSHLQRWDNRRS